MFVAQLLGSENTITGLDAATKTLTLTDGRKLQYDSLISTMPLDITLTWLGKKDWADGLTHRRVPLFTSSPSPPYKASLS